MSAWLDRLLGGALTLAAVAILLNWAWTLIRPLVPVIAVATAIGIAIAMTTRRLRG